MSILRFLPLGAGLLCVQLDFFSLTLALPEIARSLDTTVTDLQWLVSGYLLALGAFTVPAGRFADLVGRQRTLLIGLAVFGLMSLACGLSTEALPLILFRILQGIGAALVVPTTFSLVTAAADERTRPTATGAIIGIGGLGTALGPLVGGVLAVTAGWQWVFLLNAPLTVVAILGVFLLREPPAAVRSARPDPDLAGLATVIVGLAGLSLGIDGITEFGPLSPLTLLPLAAGILVLGLFVLRERRAKDPLVEPELLRSRGYSALLIVGAVATMVGNVFILMATIDLEAIRGFSADESGILFIAGSVGFAVAGPIAGVLCARFSPFRVLAAAALLAAVSLVIVALAGDLPLYLAALFLAGISCGMSNAVTQVGVQGSVALERVGEANSFLLMVTIATGGIAVVIATGALEALGTGGSPTQAGIDAVLGGAAVVMLVTGLTVLLVHERQRRDARLPAGRPGQADGI